LKTKSRFMMPTFVLGGCDWIRSMLSGHNKLCEVLLFETHYTSICVAWFLCWTCTQQGKYNAGRISIHCCIHF